MMLESCDLVDLVVNNGSSEMEFDSFDEYKVHYHGCHFQANKGNTFDQKPLFLLHE